jgi:DUF4097 and DUF4098 domain-containing protein YvlB
MNTRTLALTLALAATATTAFAAEATFSRTLNVSGAPTISISTGAGYIHVTTGPQSTVSIQARVKSEHGWFNGGGSDVDRVKDITANPPIVQNGSAITIGPANDDSRRYRNISIDYDVTLPPNTTLKVESGSGDIAVANVLSLVSAETGSGDIHLNNVGPTPHVSTGSGSIRAEAVHGAANLETGSGDIEFHQQVAGDLKAVTGSGSIRLYGTNGAVKAQTGSGDIEIDGNPSAEWKLETGSGSVRLALGPQSRCNLNASTGSGSVNVSAPIARQAGLEKQHISGAIRGGGPTVRISTGSGDISVR